MVKGPVPFSCNEAKLGEVAEAGVGSTALFASAHFLSMMYQPSHCVTRIGFGVVRMTSTVLSSILTNFAPEGTTEEKLEPLARTRSADNRTSSAVKSSPL